MAHPRPPEALASPAGEPFAVPQLRRAWRAFARAQGLPRPPSKGKHVLPHGLPAALCAPVMAQQWLAAQDGAPPGAPPAAVALREDIVSSVDPDGALVVEAAQQGAGVWVTSCLQSGDVVARVTWTWTGG